MYEALREKCEHYFALFELISEKLQEISKFLSKNEYDIVGKVVQNKTGIFWGFSEFASKTAVSLLAGA